MVPYGYVYRIRNKINGKTYVGQRKLCLDKSWRHYMGSGVAVKAAIEKHGSRFFVKELLEYSFTPLELNNSELRLIRLEKSLGSSEYNLHVGSPVPSIINSFARMSEEEKAICFSKIAESNRSRAKEKYDVFVKDYGDVIFERFHELKNVTKVAKELNVSIKYTNRFLKDSGIQLIRQPLSDATKNNISIGMSKSPKVPVRKIKFANDENAVFKFHLDCAFCNKKINTDTKRKYCSRLCFDGDHKKRNISPADISRFYWDENMSTNQIGKLYSVSGQTIRNQMRDQGIEIRKSNS